MEEQEQNPNNDLDDALKSVQKNKHQDLARENLGNEPEEINAGKPDSPFKLKKTLDDKRPEDSSIEKGWTVDSNTSRNAADQNDIANK